MVGAANSGAEIALELSHSHQTWLSGRHPGNEPTRPRSALNPSLVGGVGRDAAYIANHIASRDWSNEVFKRVNP